MKRFDIDGLIAYLGFNSAKEFCQTVNVSPNTVTSWRKKYSDGDIPMKIVLRIQEACPKKDLTPYMPVYAQIVENSDWKYKRKNLNKKQEKP